MNVREARKMLNEIEDFRELIETDLYEIVETLEIEIQRLCWHYPMEGDIPDQDVEILFEPVIGVKRCGFYKIGKYSHSKEFSYLSACVRRWRYIE